MPGRVHSISATWLGSTPWNLGRGGPAWGADSSPAPRLSCLPRAVTLSGVARAVCTRGKAEEACLLYGAVSPRGLPNPPSVRAAGSAQGPVSDEFARCYRGGLRE